MIFRELGINWDWGMGSFLFQAGVLPGLPGIGQSR